jgi:hypothetical protein
MQATRAYFDGLERARERGAATYSGSNPQMLVSQLEKQMELDNFVYGDQDKGLGGGVDLFAGEEKRKLKKRHKAQAKAQERIAAKGKASRRAEEQAEKQRHARKQHQLDRLGPFERYMPEWDEVQKDQKSKWESGRAKRDEERRTRLQQRQEKIDLFEPCKLCKKFQFSIGRLCRHCTKRRVRFDRRQVQRQGAAQTPAMEGEPATSPHSRPSSSRSRGGEVEAEKLCSTGCSDEEQMLGTMEIGAIELGDEGMRGTEIREHDVKHKLRNPHAAVADTMAHDTMAPKMAPLMAMAAALAAAGAAIAALSFADGAAVAPSSAIKASSRMIEERKRIRRSQRRERLQQNKASLTSVFDVYGL